MIEKFLSETSIHQIKWSAIFLGVAALLVLALALTTTGCVTAAKNTYADLTATPAPTPTPTLPPTPTPTPIPTPTIEEWMSRTNGRWQGEWLTWRRDNVSGYQDMQVHVTVYGYRFMPHYSWHSPSWGTKAFFQEPAAPGMQYLFVLVNMFSDGDDVRMYGMDADHFRVQVGQKTYAPDQVYRPELSIRELDDVWDLAHVAAVQPYGYVVRNNLGVVTADELGWLKGGKSNAWDGYIIFQVPDDATPENTKVLGRFDNLGGSAWWQLR